MVVAEWQLLLLPPGGEHEHSIGNRLGARHEYPVVDLDRCRLDRIAFWPARVAGRKGRSFVGCFIFSLFFFPAALIVAYAVHDRAYLSPRAAAGAWPP
jgi:hypothetical protein